MGGNDGVVSAVLVMQVVQVVQVVQVGRWVVLTLSIPPSHTTMICFTRAESA